MKGIIKKNYKQFLFRGCLSMGGGPTVLAIVYAIIQLCGVNVVLNGYEVALGIITITALAFIAGGVTPIIKLNSFLQIRPSFYAFIPYRMIIDENAAEKLLKIYRMED